MQSEDGGRERGEGGGGGGGSGKTARVKTLQGFFFVFFFVRSPAISLGFTTFG